MDMTGRTKSITRKSLRALGAGVVGAAMLSACVAVWGAPYKVEFKSSSSITFSYDPMMANWGEVQNIAQEHCGQYGKDATVHKQNRSDWGLITVEYNCKKRVR